MKKNFEVFEFISNNYDLDTDKITEI